MTNTRREVFKFAGGAAAGALLTPAPWRLITDAALWSENWPGIPVPARGEIRAKVTNCSLCPAGCRLRARCVDDRPVSLAGAGCAFGVTAHHLPYHPARLRQGPAAEAAAAFARRSPGDGIAVLDLNPGRTASWTLRRAMGALSGTYISADPNPIAYDLHAAKTVLSVGAPLLERWGTPANVIAARPNFHLIHAGAVETPTAMAADEWIRIPAGGEAAFVANLPAAVRSRLEQDGPSLVIGDAAGIFELNRSLQAPVYARPEAPVSDSWKKQAAPVTALTAVADHSIRFLLIDESSPVTYIPWHSVERKLARENPVVVTFTATRGGYARHATFALPVAVFPELAEDVPAAADQLQESFRLATPLMTPIQGASSAAEFAGALADVPAASALRERADEIYRRTHPQHATADDFWKSLTQGESWSGGRPGLPPGAPAPASLQEIESADDLPLVAISSPGVPPLISPLMTKVYQESNLHLAPNMVALNAACGLEQGARAILQTRLGKCAVHVAIDDTVPPGAVLTGSSPGIHDICAHGAHAKVVLS
jgi:anaerobic selenocysteine-containing dehydrogenase